MELSKIEFTIIEIIWMIMVYSWLGMAIQSIIGDSLIVATALIYWSVFVNTINNKSEK